MQLKNAPQLARGDLNSFNVISNSSEAGLKLPSRPKRHGPDGAITLLQSWLIFQFMQNLHF